MFKLTKKENKEYWSVSFSRSNETDHDELSLYKENSPEDLILELKYDMDSKCCEDFDMLL